MDLFIVRHGRPVRQVVKEGEGAADPELSAIGLQQAERVANVLETADIDHIVASTMLRARQTAAPLAGRLGLEVELLDGHQGVGSPLPFVCADGGDQGRRP